MLGSNRQLQPGEPCDAATPAWQAGASRGRENPLQHARSRGDDMTKSLDAREGDFTIREFRFGSGDLLDLRQHYRLLGEPRRGPGGEIVNAVLLLHNTTGDSSSWLTPELGGELFGPGQPLDT